MKGKFLFSLITILILFSFFCSGDKSKISVVLNINLPYDMLPNQIEFDYQIGYGETKIDFLIKEEKLKYEWKGKAFESSFNIDKLNYSKYLIFVYNVKIKVIDGENNLLGGGHNAVNLVYIKKPLERIKLLVGYDEENKSLSFVPEYF